MELYANINQLVHIDPKLVVENLIKKELGYDKWVFEKEGKFYMGFTQGAGSHSFDDKYEITEEKYRYMQALNVILKYLEKIQL
jgi:hypothetical protein